MRRACLIYHLKTPLIVSIPAGVLAAALGGYLLGRLVLRMRTIYLSIATWAFAETYRIVLTAAYEFTRGDLGLSVPSLYGHVRPTAYYYTFVGAAAVCVLLTHVILRSPIGYFMRAVKDDQMRAQSLGVDTTKVKLFAFTLSSAMAGLGGVLYAHYVLTLTPAIVDFSEMAKIIIIVVIGGMGYFIGPVLAAPPINFLSTYLQAFGEWSLVHFRRRRDRGDALLPGGTRRPCGEPASPLAGRQTLRLQPRRRRVRHSDGPGRRGTITAAPVVVCSAMRNLKKQIPYKFGGAFPRSPHASREARRLGPSSLVVRLPNLSTV